MAATRKLIESVQKFLQVIDAEADARRDLERRLGKLETRPREFSYFTAEAANELTTVRGALARAEAAEGDTPERWDSVAVRSALHHALGLDPDSDFAIGPMIEAVAKLRCECDPKCAPRDQPSGFIGASCPYHAKFIDKSERDTDGARAERTITVKQIHDVLVRCIGSNNEDVSGSFWRDFDRSLADLFGANGDAEAIAVSEEVAAAHRALRPIARAAQGVVNAVESMSQSERWPLAFVSAYFALRDAVRGLPPIVTLTIKPGEAGHTAGRP